MRLMYDEKFDFDIEKIHHKIDRVIEFDLEFDVLIIITKIKKKENLLCTQTTTKIEISLDY